MMAWCDECDCVCLCDISLINETMDRFVTEVAKNVTVISSVSRITHWRLFLSFCSYTDHVLSRYLPVNAERAQPGRRHGIVYVLAVSQIACKRYINVYIWLDPFDFGYG